MDFTGSYLMRNGETVTIEASSNQWNRESFRIPAEAPRSIYSGYEWDHQGDAHNTGSGIRHEEYDLIERLRDAERY